MKKNIKRKIFFLSLLALFAWVGNAIAVTTVIDDQSTRLTLSGTDSAPDGPSQVPEPGTILLFGSGLIGFSYVLRRGLLMTNALRHFLNPLHVYCRLRDMGLGKGVASSFCVFYEKAVFRFLVRSTH